MKLIEVDRDPGSTPRASIVVVMEIFPNENVDLMLRSTGKIGSKFEVIVVSRNIQHGIIFVKSYLNELLSSIPNLVKIRVLAMESLDRGPSYRRNVGALLAESPILVFADDDTALVEDIGDLFTYLEKGLCQGVQPLILRLHNPEIIDSAGDFVRRSRLRITYNPYCRWAGVRVKDVYRNLCVEETPSMRSAFMAVSKEAFFLVGGFDTTYGYNFEDVDLGWRMQMAGYKLLFIPTVRVLHRGGRTTDPGKRNEGVERIGLLNYFATQLKVAGFSKWPILLGIFYITLARFELSRIQRGKINLINAMKDFVTMNRAFIERAKAAIIYKRILVKRFSLVGRKKLEEMAEGKRFIYGQC